MNNTPPHAPQKRDYSTISSSARQLLLLKGFGDIPFVKEAAQLMLHPKQYINNLDNMDFPFKARLMHFESRYRSIDQLMEGLAITNVLELSSGFSFRGLDLIQHKVVFYIDTDLPDVIEMKKSFVEALASKNSTPRGTLQTLPLNALDEQQFKNTVALFPPGPIAILTEGLLMYLSVEEKQNLCGIIHNILKERGGYWIVADVYVRKQIDLKYVMVNENLQAFYDLHNIEANKFESYDAAEKFFGGAGFVLDKVGEAGYNNLTGMQNFMATAGYEKADIVKSASQVRATWRLKIAE